MILLSELIKHLSIIDTIQIAIKYSETDISDWTIDNAKCLMEKSDEYGFDRYEVVYITALSTDRIGIIVKEIK